MSPPLLIGGTFQTSGRSGLLAAREAVPPFDGLHVIQQRRMSWIFITCQGELVLAHPSITTVDDLKQALDSAGDRLHLH
jgi:hypothetical protein